MHRYSLSRRIAAARFALSRPAVSPGDTVEFLRSVGYRARADERHLAWVPAGSVGVVRAIGPMPGASGGALVDLLDATGRRCGYWTAAHLSELRRLRRPATRER